MSVVEPKEPHLRLYAVDDERLWESRPRLHAEEFALVDVGDDEWEAFYSAMSDGDRATTLTHVVIDTDVRADCWILGRRHTPRKPVVSSETGPGSCRS